MIPARYGNIVFAFYMSLIMSNVMSLFISLINVGFIEGIVGIWLRAWGLAFVVAFPTVVLVTPLVRRLVALSLSSNDLPQRGA